MDDRKPSILPSETRSRPASDWTSAAVDSPPAADAGSVVVYYGNAEEVSRGFLIALSAMGVAPVEQFPEPAEPPVRGAKS
jgi:hypothetical protein